MPHFVPFTRIFRNFSRLFPGYPLQGPVGVATTMDLMTDILRASIVHDVRFSTNYQTAATGGASTTLTHPEPESGRFHLPVHWEITYNGATQIHAVALLVPTTSALDPWGRWTDTQRTICSVRISQSVFVLVPGAMPYMRGNQLAAIFPAPGAGTTVESVLWVVDLPAELVTVDHWRQSYTNFVFNFPVP